jgi:hypothetical protein
MMPNKARSMFAASRRSGSSAATNMVRSARCFASTPEMVYRRALSISSVREVRIDGLRTRPSILVQAIAFCMPQPMTPTVFRRHRWKDYTPVGREVHLRAKRLIAEVVRALCKAFRVTLKRNDGRRCFERAVKSQMGRSNGDLPMDTLPATP